MVDNKTNKQKTVEEESAAVGNSAEMQLIFFSSFGV